MTDEDDDDDGMDLSPPWKQAAIELFDGRFSYGDLVPHAELQTAFRLPKPVGLVQVEAYERWRLALLAQMEGLSSYLLEEKNMCLRPVNGQGYRIVQPEKQTE